MNKLLLLILSSLYVCIAQGQPYQIEFNKKGEHIKGFPQHILTGDEIKFTYTSDSIILVKAVKALDSLINFHKLLENDDSVRTFLRIRPHLLWTFVNTDSLSKVDTSQSIDSLRFYINKFKYWIKDIGKQESKTTVKYFPIINTAINNFIFKKAENNSDFTNATGNTFTWKDFRLVKYQVIKEQTSNVILSNHLNSTQHLLIKNKDWIDSHRIELYKKTDILIKRLDSLFNDTLRTQFLGLEKETEQTKNEIVKQYSEFQKIIAEQEKLQFYIIRKNKEWIKSWLWFTGLKPLLNPFDILSSFPGEDNLEALEFQTKMLQQKIEFIQKNIEQKNLKKFSTVDSLIAAANQVQKLNEEAEKNNKKIANLKNQKTDYENNIARIQVKSQVMQHGTLWGQEDKTIKWMRYHDATNFFKLENKDKHPKKYFEEDEVLQIAVNVPYAMKVSLEETIESYEPKSVVTEALEPVLDALLTNLTDYFDKFKVQPKSSFGSFKDPREDILNSDKGQYKISYKPKDNKELSEFKNDYNLMPREKDGTIKVDSTRLYLKRKHPNFTSDQIQKIIETSNLVDSLIKLSYDQYLAQKDQYKIINENYQYIKILYNWNSNTSDVITKLTLKEKTDTVLFTTNIMPVKEMDGFKTNSYKISSSTGTSTKLEYQSKYSKYKTSLVQPFGAFVFTNKAEGRTSLSYNPQTQTFTNIDLGTTDVVLGIKIFPFNTWIENNSFVGANCKSELKSKHKIKRGLSPLNRIAVTAGLGVTKQPLRNYFTGLSFDVISGLGLQGGYNFYTTKNYELENGNVKREYDSFRGNWYFGVSLDPVVLIKLFNIFNFGQ